MGCSPHLAYTTAFEMKCLYGVTVRSKKMLKWGARPRDIVVGWLAADCTTGCNFGTVQWLFENFNWWTLHAPVHIILWLDMSCSSAILVFLLIMVSWFSDGRQIFRNKILRLALNALKRKIWSRNNYALGSNFFLGCFLGHSVFACFFLHVILKAMFHKWSLLCIVHLNCLSICSSHYHNIIWLKSYIRSKTIQVGTYTPLRKTWGRLNTVCSKINLSSSRNLDQKMPKNALFFRKKLQKSPQRWELRPAAY